MRHKFRNEAGVLSRSVILRVFGWKLCMGHDAGENRKYRICTNSNGKGKFWSTSNLLLR
jgi:hypothetical protein